VRACLVIIAVFVTAFCNRLFADTTNQFGLQSLISKHLPNAHLRLDDAGNPKTLVSSSGDSLNLAAAFHETPQPTNTVVGYWFSPTMDFLSRQRMKAATPEEAVDIIQFLHVIWRGPEMARQKLYNARPIDAGWLVTVDHDFTNFPASVQAIMPYELLVDNARNVVQLRQRCYHYPGNSVVYTNTVISVYNREIKINHGLNYPEALEKELRNAWKKEQRQDR
jgi:hypothetical protein